MARSGSRRPGGAIPPIPIRDVEPLVIGDETLDLVGRIASLLDRLAIPYLVGGSVASTFFGEPRGTRDVDLVVSSAQWRDVVGILATRRELLDSPYLDRAAAPSVGLGGPALRAHCSRRGGLSQAQNAGYGTGRVRPIDLASLIQRS